MISEKGGIGEMKLNLFSKFYYNHVPLKVFIIATPENTKIVRSILPLDQKIDVTSLQDEEFTLKPFSRTSSINVVIIAIDSSFRSNPILMESLNTALKKQSAPTLFNEKLILLPCYLDETKCFPELMQWDYVRLDPSSNENMNSARNDISSIFSKYKKKNYKKFFDYCITGIIFIILLSLAITLQTTSVIIDYIETGEVPTVATAIENDSIHSNVIGIGDPCNQNATLRSIIISWIPNSLRPYLSTHPLLVYGIIFIFVIMITFLLTSLIYFFTTLGLNYLVSSNKSSETYAERYQEAKFRRENIENESTEKSNNKNEMDILARMLVNLDDIQNFWRWNQKRLNHIFFISVGMCIVGFIFLALSFTSLIYLKEYTYLSIICTIGGVLTEFIAATALVLHNKILTQSAFYYKSLHENERFLSCLAVLDKIKDPARYDDLLMEIIKNELQLNTINLSEDSNKSTKS